jgi:hypothetical protein
MNQGLFGSKACHVGRLFASPGELTVEICVYFAAKVAARGAGLQFKRSAIILVSVEAGRMSEWARAHFFVR